MAPPSWTTAEEVTWLQAKIGNYLTHKAEKTLWKFWPQMQEGWFRAFPEESRLNLPGLTPEGDAPHLTPEQSSELTSALTIRKEVSRVSGLRTTRPPHLHFTAA